ncbi:hypothetical protein [Agrococcus sp. ARC_14]|uniref:DUF6966 domain-containing protein n=1 Tax=Agrococcus sp. ARC_14 TaxID=2919927 RepID=UPI001F052FCA|nr:hypothetical protein [Agrococcus sp. ARC_14]MCH1882521.1 hypothetical protein [Agrococcus sp. ARC_14]
MTTARWQAQLDDVRRAIAQLRAACAADGDARRASSADWLGGLFEDVADAESLQQSARQALGLYTGGMGSFHDVGTATMASAVDALRTTLHSARNDRR